MMVQESPSNDPVGEIDPVAGAVLTPQVTPVLDSAVAAD